MHAFRQLVTLLAILSTPAAASAGVTYSLKLQTLNQSYTSTLTVNPGSGGSGSITQVSSVYDQYGESTTYAGSSTGQMTWDGSDLHVSYSVDSTSFTMTLSNVSFTLGTAADGLPEGRLRLPVSPTPTGSPQLTIPGGTTVPWLFSSITEFKREGLLGDPPAVPGPGALAVVGGLALIGGRRRR